MGQFILYGHAHEAHRAMVCSACFAYVKLACSRTVCTALLAHLELSAMVYSACFAYMKLAVGFVTSILCTYEASLWDDVGGDQHAASICCPSAHMLPGLLQPACPETLHYALTAHTKAFAGCWPCEAAGMHKHCWRFSTITTYAHVMHDECRRFLLHSSCKHHNSSACQKKALSRALRHTLSMAG